MPPRSLASIPRCFSTSAPREKASKLKLLPKPHLQTIPRRLENLLEMKSRIYGMHPDNPLVFRLPSLLPVEELQPLFTPFPGFARAQTRKPVCFLYSLVWLNTFIIHF